jgi:hypothetical protein
MTMAVLVGSVVAFIAAVLVYRLLPNTQPRPIPALPGEPAAGAVDDPATPAGPSDEEAAGKRDGEPNATIDLREALLVSADRGPDVPAPERPSD